MAVNLARPYGELHDALVEFCGYSIHCAFVSTDRTLAVLHDSGSACWVDAVCGPAVAALEQADESDP